MQIPRYRVLREVGRGQDSVVYLAIQESLERHVALKLIAPVARNKDDVLAYLHACGENSVRLNHHNIAPVFDTGICEHGCYLAMEYLPGGDLNQYLMAPSGQLKRHRVRALLLDVVDALAHAYQQGVIHRNIKPSNILFRDDGTTVLTDFAGFRTPSKRRESSNCINPTSSLYISPEQARTGQGSMQSDQYSLGVILYECLTGDLKHPLRLKQTIPELPCEYADFQLLMNRLLARNPNYRYPSWKLLGDAVKQLPLVDTNARMALKTGALQQVLYPHGIVAGLGFFSAIVAGALFYSGDEGHQITAVAELEAVSPRPIQAPQQAAATGTAFKRSDDGDTSVASKPVPAQITATTPELLTGESSAIILHKDADSREKSSTIRDNHSEDQLVNPAKAPSTVDKLTKTTKNTETFDKALTVADQAKKGATKMPDSISLNPAAQNPAVQNPAKQLAEQAANEIDEALPSVQIAAKEQSVAIALYLAEVKGRMNAEQFSIPSGHSAMQTYQQVLALEADNQQAKNSNTASAAEYAKIKIAYSKRHAGEFASPSAYIDDVDRNTKTAPSEQNRPELQRQTQQQPSEQKPQQSAEITRLLAEAEVHRKAMRYSTPYARSALRAYRRVLALDAGNQQAENGIQAIAAEYAKIARRKQRAGEFASAAVYIDRGLKVAPSDRTLLALQRQIQQQRSDQKQGQETARTENNNRQSEAVQQAMAIGELDLDGWSKK